MVLYVMPGLAGVLAEVATWVATGRGEELDWGFGALRIRL